MNELNAENKSLEDFQDLIDYRFRDPSLLRQALTTPLRGHIDNRPHYEILETIGDVVLKLALSLNIYDERENSPGELTQKKQMIENDSTLAKIAMDYFQLDEFIIKEETQRIRKTKILADILEAICGALFLDSGKDIEVVNEKIVKKFYIDWRKLTKDSSVFSKNQLLEYLQSLYKVTPLIRAKFNKVGMDHDPQWRARAPKIFTPNNQLILKLPKDLRSDSFKSKKEAEKNLYKKIYDYLKNEQS